MNYKERRRRQKAPASEKMTIHSALSHKGYYDKENNWNSLTTLERYPGKVFRNRVEVLIFNDKNQIYLCKEDNFYRVPGGSIEKNRSNLEQVKAEAKEEARLNITNIKNTRIDYVRLFSKPYVPYGGSVYWDGVYNVVFTADYVSHYDGKIKTSLKDNHMYRSGKFYNISEVFPYLKYEYRKAILQRKKNKHDERHKKQRQRRD